MSRFLGDVCARASGLGTRLLPRRALERLAQAAGTAELARGLEAAGCRIDAADGGALVATIDAALARRAGAQLSLLVRWLGGRAAAFAVVLEEEDRRSLRALLRSAGHGLAATARLAGLVPTAALPEERLAKLARAGTREALVEALVRTGSPYGGPLRAALRVAGPDLLELETALQRSFAARATAAAARGGPGLVAYAREGVDLENAWTALLEPGPSPRASGAFLDGGRALTRRRFRAALAETSAERRCALLAAALAGTPLAPVFARASGSDAPLEAELLAARLAGQRRAARIDPLGPAPILVFALRVRAELADLRRITWGVALGTPPGVIRRELAVAP